MNRYTKFLLVCAFSLFTFSAAAQSEADSLLTLREVPVYKFKLIDASGRSSANSSNPIPGKVVFNGLPNPNPSQIGISELDGTQVPTSPMYIYV